MEAPIAAYVFDLYGTLLDYGSLRTHFEGLGADADAFVATWREKQLGYAMASTLMGRYADFDTLTGAAFAYAAEKYGLAADEAAVHSARALWDGLPAFPDVVPALDALRSKGHRTAVLSNGTVASIERGIRGAGLAERFDALLSVEAVSAYKPDPRVYALAGDRFGVPLHRIAFVSSNGWDATGAAAYGFTTIWCNRAGLPAERFGPPAARSVSSLAELLDA